MYEQAVQEERSYGCLSGLFYLLQHIDEGRGTTVLYSLDRASTGQQYVLMKSCVTLLHTLGISITPGAVVCELSLSGCSR